MLACASASPPLAAQSATGWLVVEVEDALGRAVPGAEIAVDGEGVRSRPTDDDGRVVFAHLGPGESVVQATTAGGGRATGRVLIAPAGTTTLRLVLGPTAEEEVASTEARPSTIDAGRLFGPRELRDQPRPSDPWSFLRDVPGVVLDRVDVGGSETAQQALVVSRGDPGSGVTWTLDGADVTDPAALGSSTLYTDTDVLGALAVRTSSLDARVRTPGVQVGLFTPVVRGTWKGAVHLNATGPQSDNLPDALAGRPFPRPRTGQVFEIGRAHV